MPTPEDYLEGLRREREYALAKGKPTDLIDAEIARVEGKPAKKTPRSKSGRRTDR